MWLILKAVAELTHSSMAPFWLIDLPNSRALIPVMSSNKRMPNPNTSVFSDDWPVERYSGAIWPTVPRTAVVTWESEWSRSFARPKSPTIASQKSSRSTLAAFTSLWIIFGSHCSCRYNRPLAAPIAILFLVFQSNAGFSVAAIKAWY